MKPVELTVPMKLVTSLNSRIHFMVRAKNVKRERQLLALAWRRDGGVKVAPVLCITITRMGPRLLDGDNLQSVAKGVRDQVAAELKINDGSALIDWQYRQEKGPYAVRVRIEALTPTRLVPVE